MAQHSSLPPHQVAYPDVAPVMLLSESSVKDLSSRLESNVTVERFRPNIVISDCEAFQEVGFVWFLFFFPISGRFYSSQSLHWTRCDSIKEDLKVPLFFSFATYFLPVFWNPQTPKRLFFRIPGRKSRSAMWGCSVWCHVDGNTANASDGPWCSDVTPCVQIHFFSSLSVVFSPQWTPKPASSTEKSLWRLWKGGFLTVLAHDFLGEEPMDDI